MDWTGGLHLWTALNAWADGLQRREKLIKVLIVVYKLFSNLGTSWEGSILAKVIVTRTRRPYTKDGAQCLSKLSDVYFHVREPCIKAHKELFHVITCTSCFRAKAASDSSAQTPIGNNVH